MVNYLVVYHSYNRGVIRETVMAKNPQAAADYIRGQEQGVFIMKIAELKMVKDWK